MTTSTMFYCLLLIASHSSVFHPSLRSISSSPFHLRPKSRNFISLNESSSFPRNSISIKTRSLCVVSASKSDNGSQESSFQGAESFFRSVLASMEKVYLNRNPTAKQILELVQFFDSNQICYDHLAFETSGILGCGLASLLCGGGAGGCRASIDKQSSSPNLSDNQKVLGPLWTRYRHRQH